MGNQKQNLNTQTQTTKEMQAISNNNNDLNEVFSGDDELSRQGGNSRVNIFINNRQQRSSYLSDEEEGESTTRREEGEEQKDQRDLIYVQRRMDLDAFLSIP